MPDAYRNTVGWLLTATAFVLCPLLAFGPKLDLGLAVILILAAAGSAATMRAKPALPGVAPFAVLVALVLWGGLSASWSLDPARSLDKALALAVLLAAAVALLALFKVPGGGLTRPLAVALCLGFALTLALFAFEVASNGWLISRLHDTLPDRSPVTGYNRATVVVAAVGWPVLVIALRAWGRWAGLVLVGTVTAVLWGMQDAAAALGFVFGLCVFALALAGPRATHKVVAALVLVSVIAAPFVVAVLSAEIQPRALARRIDDISVTHRLVIWDFASQKALGRSVTGYGLDTSRLVPGARDRVRLGTGKATGELLPNHPHNAALQWWLELGFPGAALGGAFLAWVALAIARTIEDRLSRAAALAQFTGLFTVTMISFSIWQAWFLAAIVLTVLVSRPVFLDPGRGPDVGRTISV